MLQSENVGFDADVDNWIRGVTFLGISILWLLAFSPIVALFTIGPEGFFDWVPITAFGYCVLTKEMLKWLPFAVVIVEICVLAALATIAECGGFGTPFKEMRIGEC
ncbi:MAG: hypothetical protein SFV23_01235 [Planctomycetaceae bacterium]|nr:hypothetical protein [Planctomycetaceae bacterium]